MQLYVTSFGPDSLPERRCGGAAAASSANINTGFFFSLLPLFIFQTKARREPQRKVLEHEAAIGRDDVTGTVSSQWLQPLFRAAGLRVALVT